MVDLPTAPAEAGDGDVLATRERVSNGREHGPDRGLCRCFAIPASPATRSTMSLFFMPSLP